MTGGCEGVALNGDLFAIDDATARHDGPLLVVGGHAACNASGAPRGKRRASTRCALAHFTRGRATGVMLDAPSSELTASPGRTRRTTGAEPRRQDRNRRPARRRRRAVVPHALKGESVEKRLLASDLFNYLISLSSLLGSVGEADAGNQVLYVSKFASGSTSELYGEARLLLPKVLRNTGGKLQELDRARLREVIAGIEREFGRVGGR